MQFFSSEDLRALADTFCHQMVMTNLSPFCFLSVQKQEVKSYGALSKEVQKQAWLWKWGTGWLDRQAESLQMAAWTAIAQKESEWDGYKVHLFHAFLTIFSISLFLLSQK